MQTYIRYIKKVKNRRMKIDDSAGCQKLTHRVLHK